MSNHQANNLKSFIDQTMQGAVGALKVASDMLEETKKNATTNEEKEALAKELHKSGVVKEFESIQQKLKEFNNGR